MTLALVLMGVTILLLTAALVLSLLSRTSSPTASTKPTPTSDDSETSLIPMISQMFLESQKATMDLVVTLVQGREPPPTSQREIEQIESVNQIGYDYDSTPLSPGIEQVEQREAEEALLEVSLRERRVWQDRMSEVARLEAEKLSILADLEIQSPGPWNGAGPEPT